MHSLPHPQAQHAFALLPCVRQSTVTVHLLTPMHREVRALVRCDADVLLRAPHIDCSESKALELGMQQVEEPSREVTRTSTSR